MYLTLPNWPSKIIKSTTAECRLFRGTQNINQNRPFTEPYSLNTFQNDEIIWSIFSDHSGIKSELNKKKVTLKTDKSKQYTFI